MTEAATPKRPKWFWPVVSGIVLLLGVGAFAAPSVIECAANPNGFGACIAGKIAGIGSTSAQADKTALQPAAVAVAQPADTATVPAASGMVAPPDFGARVEPNGSIVIVGSGAKGKTVQIFVNGTLFGTADVDATGDWVLVPDAPLPPGGYELTLVDPETGQALDKSIVVAINQDLTSEPLVVASTPGKASEILQGLASASTAVASAETPNAAPTAPATEAKPAETPAAVATAQEPNTVVETINQAAAAPVGSADLASTPPTVPETKPAEQAAVATAEPAKPAEDVVGDVDALQKRIDALKAAAAPTIDAVEIDNGKNYFAGTGADGAVVRVYVDNAFVGDAKVNAGHWLLETGDVLKNRSQRVRADQLAVGSAEVASRAEIDFIFEEPAATAVATAPAENPVTVPPADFAVDTSTAPAVAVEPKVAEAAPATSKPAETAAADAPSAAPVAVAEEKPAAAADVATATGQQPSGASGSSASSSAVAVPKPDFSVDTGIAVTIVPEAPAKVAETQPAAGTAAATPEAAKPETPVAVATVEPAPAAGAEVPQLVAEPVGAPEFGRFATGKAIIRSGDNLWTIARRVYGAGYKYTQIYGANREAIRNPNLIYPGQVFSLPDVKTEAATASN